MPTRMETYHFKFCKGFWAKYLAIVQFLKLTDTKAKKTLR